MRPFALAAVLALGSASGASVRYTFSSVFGSFALVAPGPITKPTQVQAGRLASPKGFLGAKLVSAEFRPGWAESDTLVVRQNDRREYTFVFPKGAFSRFGVSGTRVGIRGSLTLARGPQTPVHSTKRSSSGGVR